jgi:hypothetical protein
LLLALRTSEAREHYPAVYQILTGLPATVGPATTSSQKACLHDLILARRDAWERDFRYDTAGYRRAIERACDKAFPLPENFAPRQLKEGKPESRATWWAR